MPAMQLYFWERAKAACYLYVAYVRNAVAAILNLILLLRKIAIGAGAASLGIDRLGRKQKVE